MPNRVFRTSRDPGPPQVEAVDISSVKLGDLAAASATITGSADEPRIFTTTLHSEGLLPRLILSLAVFAPIGMEANLCRTYEAHYFVRKPAQAARRKKPEPLT